MEFIFEIAIFFATALAIGVVGNIAGIGGGVLLMVVLLFVFKMNPVLAGGFSLLTIIASTMAGSMFNIKAKAIGKRLFYVIAAAAGAGAVIGSIISYFVAVGTFDLAFGFTSMSLGIFSLAATKAETRKGKGGAYLKESFNDYKLGKDASASPGAGYGTGAVALTAGLLAGLFGIGIGAVTGTFLTAIRRLNPKTAFSTVVAAMIITSAIGATVHFLKPGLELSSTIFAVPLIIGGALGGIIGAYASTRMSFVALRSFQGYIILLLGIIAIASSLAGA
ncbi:MAG: TSUP family transporter [Candidatus Micrarchaeia archaeon]